MSAKKRTTIASLEIENLRRLTFARAEFLPEVGLVVVTGKNGQGKTSLLESIAGALGGAGEVHAHTLREGAENGRSTLKLTNGFTVERRVTESAPKGYLTVKSQDGGKYGQEILDGWMGEGSFDPLALFQLKGDRIRKLLLSLGKDPDLPQKLAKNRAAAETTYNERTPVIARRRHLSAVKAPEGERPKPIDISAELEELRNLQAIERRRGDLIREDREARQAAFRAADAARKEAESHIDDLEGERADNASYQSDLNEKIEEIQAKLAAAVERLTTAKEDEKSINKRIKAARLALRETRPPEDAADAIPLPAVPDDPSEAIAAVQARMETAEKVQEALAPWKRYDEAQEELQELAGQEETLGAQLRALKAQESKLLEDAGIPIAGLSFGEEGEPLLNGRPLDVASGRERIDFAVDVAIASDPEVGVCLLDEANDLDLDALAALDLRARENGFQIWVVRIGLEGPGEIVVSDGVALGKHNPPAEEAVGE